MATTSLWHCNVDKYGVKCQRNQIQTQVLVQFSCFFIHSRAYQAGTIDSDHLCQGSL